jgi:hypothetical protein
MNASSINDLLLTLETKINELQEFLTAKGDAEIDLHSDHTFYGLTSAVIDDLNEAKDLVIGAVMKIRTVVSDNEY